MYLDTLTYFYIHTICTYDYFAVCKKLHIKSNSFKSNLGNHIREFSFYNPSASFCKTKEHLSFYVNQHIYPTGLLKKIGTINSMSVNNI